MSASSFMTLVGSVLVGFSTGAFIGWWAVPLTAGIAILCAAVAQDVIDELRR